MDGGHFPLMEERLRATEVHVLGVSKARIDRWIWLLRRARTERTLDVLNAKLVDDYIQAFDAPFWPACWGSHKCRQLGTDLSAMAKLGILRRNRTGLSGGAWRPWFPTWVWSYRPGLNAGLLDLHGQHRE